MIDQETIDADALKERIISVIKAFESDLEILSKLKINRELDYIISVIVHDIALLTMLISPSPIGQYPWRKRKDWFE